MNRVLFIIGGFLLAAPAAGLLCACGGIAGPSAIFLMAPAAILGPVLPDGAVAQGPHGPDVLSPLGIVLIYVLPGICLLLMGTSLQTKDDEARQTANPLPDPADVASMTVTGWRPDPSGIPLGFEVPEAFWEAVLHWLTPCALDPHPCRRRLLAHLNIHTKDGKAVELHICQVDDYYRAAFSLAPRIGKRRHYRGGSAQQVRQALAAAYVTVKTADNGQPQPPPLVDQPSDQPGD